MYIILNKKMHLFQIGCRPSCQTDVTRGIIMPEKTVNIYSSDLIIINICFPINSESAYLIPDFRKIFGPNNITIKLGIICIIFFRKLLNLICLHCSKSLKACLILLLFCPFFNQILHKNTPQVREVIPELKLEELYGKLLTTDFAKQLNTNFYQGIKNTAPSVGSPVTYFFLPLALPSNFAQKIILGIKFPELLIAENLQATPQKITARTKCNEYYLYIISPTTKIAIYRNKINSEKEKQKNLPNNLEDLNSFYLAPEGIFADYFPLSSSCMQNIADLTSMNGAN